VGSSHSFVIPLHCFEGRAFSDLIIPFILRNSSYWNWFQKSAQVS